MGDQAESMIVTAQPEASEAGARVLMAGGNAVDAAMAAALVQGVVDPQMCGIAGFGSMQVYMPGKGVHGCIDFHGKTPLAATPEMWLDRLEGEARDGFGFLVRGQVNDLGYQSITTPGSLLAYSEAAAAFGTWDWEDICRPAVERAREGFLVRPHVHYWWTHGADFGRVAVAERLAFSATGRRIYFSDYEGGGAATLKKIGERVENPSLARTLERIARDGAETFYRGEIADRIAADMKDHGGLLSAEDLAGYATSRSTPLKGSYRGHEVFTNHPPGGGIMLVEMLNILENFDLARLDHNSADYIKVVAEAMKAATADKDAHVGDPAFVDVPVAELTSKETAAEIARRIEAGEKIQVERLEGLRLGGDLEGGEPSAEGPDGGDPEDGEPETSIRSSPPESPHTTHVAVVDKDGNCVTMTHSLGMPSGVITDGLGFMYNGCMAVFDPRPGRAGSIAPGKSRFSSICPTMVFKDGRPHVVIGAPGGTQIAMGVLQAILNVLDFGMTMAEAVAAPRFSATSNAIDITNRIPDYAVEPLREDGYEVIRSAMTFGIAAVHGIKIDGEELSGGADPGHDGVALGV